MFGLFGKDEQEIQKLIDAKEYDDLPTEVIDEIAKDILLTTESVLSGYQVCAFRRKRPLILI